MNLSEVDLSKGDWSTTLRYQKKLKVFYFMGYVTRAVSVHLYVNERAITELCKNKNLSKITELHKRVFCYGHVTKALLVRQYHLGLILLRAKIDLKGTLHNNLSFCFAKKTVARSVSTLCNPPCS